MKKQIVAGLLAAALAVLLLAGCAQAPDPAPDPDLIFELNLELPPAARPAAGETAEIIVATDLHLISPSIVEDGEPFQTSYLSGDGKMIHYSSQITDAFLAQVVAEKPHALILTGDLTLDGEKKSHIDLARRLAEVRQAGIGVYVIPGNHDINNGYAAGFSAEKKYPVDAVTPEEFAHIYHYSGYGDALYRDETTLSYVAEVSPELWLVMLDTNRYLVRGQMGLSQVGGEVPAETMAWLEQCLQAAEEAGAKVVSASHHNLMDHSPLIHEDYTLDNAEALRALYDQYGVRLNLSGHIHIQSINATQEAVHEIFDITTTALCVFTNQYGRLHITPGQAAHYQTVEVDVEGWARAQGMEDPNLLYFEEFAYQFFYELSYERSIYNLYMDQVPYEEAEIMAQTMGLLNPMYFSGRAMEIREEVLASDHYALWVAKGGTVSYRYNFSMLREPPYNPCEIVIPWD